MRLSLLGPEFRFHELFTAQSDRLAAAAILLREMILSFPLLVEPGRKIHELGALTDKVSRDIVRELSITSSRAADREDVHELNRAFIVSSSSIRGIASRLGLYGLRAVAPSIREMATDMVEMTEQVRKMLEVVNKGREVGQLSAAVSEIREEFDRFLLVGLGELYESGPSSSADIIEIVKWAQLYDRFEDAMGAAHRVTIILESIVLKGI